MRSMILLGNSFKFLLIVSLFFMLACSEQKQQKLKPELAVSLLPQKFLVEQIAGDLFDVFVLVPPGANHETFEPSPQDLVKVKQSVIYFKTGLFPFEEMLLKNLKNESVNPEIVNTSSGLNLIQGNNEPGHEGHNHGSFDPHIWLSLKELITQVTIISNELSKAFPEQQAIFNQNSMKFIQQADSLHKVLSERFVKSERKSFMIFHPALGYFARDYELNQIAIEHEGKTPAPAILQNLIKIAKNENIKLILIQKEFDSENARIIASDIGARIEIIDPLKYNIFDNLETLCSLIIN